PDDTLAAIDRLVGAGILERAEPVRFAHPILRAAVYDEIPGGARSAAHARTASMLGEEGTPAEEVGQHLLLVTPGEDAGTLARLRAAAVSALARGGGESSAAFLPRAGGGGSRRTGAQARGVRRGEARLRPARRRRV